jgi:hypothetical protein
LTGALLLSAAPVCAQAGASPATEKGGASPAPEKAVDALKEYRLGLEFEPIGPVIPQGHFRVTNLLPMHPAGFRASTYSLFPAPTYGLGEGWEITAGATGANRLGPGGEAIFFGAGVQKQFVKERHGLPAVSVAGYGMAGPHEHRSEALLLAATKSVLGGPRRGFTVYVHGGVRGEHFDSPDYGHSTGVRPYAGLNVSVGKRFFVAGELSLTQPWERSKLYSVGGTYLIYRSFGVSGGIHNDGYRTYPFIGLAF